MLKRGKSEQCPPQQLLCSTLWQKYSKNTVTFLFTILYSAHNENKIQYPDIDMCIGEPLVWMTPYFFAKSFHQIKEQLFIRAGFAIPEGALVSGFHCTCGRMLKKSFASVSSDYRPT